MNNKITIKDKIAIAGIMSAWQFSTDAVLNDMINKAIQNADNIAGLVKLTDIKDTLLMFENEKKL